MAANIKRMQLKRKTTLLLLYSRTAFLPIILAIAFECWPKFIFTTDWFKLLNLVVFAFTNGWLSSLCVIMTPEYVR